MAWFEKFHFSLTCRTDDFAVLHCLRALSEWANDKVPYPYKMIAWGHTKEIDWKKAGHKVIFRFVGTDSREKFIVKANELLEHRWTQTGTSDSDPATPTRQR